MAQLHPASPTGLVFHHYPLRLLLRRLSRDQLDILGLLETCQSRFLPG